MPREAAFSTDVIQALWRFITLVMSCCVQLSPANVAAAAHSADAVVHGTAGLCPIAFAAPEVLAGEWGEAVVATRASDVYMLGGLMFEVMGRYAHLLCMVDMICDRLIP